MRDPAGSSVRLSEGDASSIERYLLSFDWPGRQAEVEHGIVAGGVPLWREILRLVPSGTQPGRLLELGSPPFHITLLVQKFRLYEVVPTAGALDARSKLIQPLRSAEFGEEYVFDCACFDLEHERFPFDDASFDVVLFCEVIEHLQENPVFTLSEIHRVLRPGGSLVLSTPNASRSGNVMRLWLGANVFDQYHLGSPLRGTRHSREYTMQELTSLVSGCGFDVAIAEGHNLGQIQFTRRTRWLEPFFRALTFFAPGVHADYLFLRASRSGPFRWTFPREIFDQGHLDLYLEIRDAQMVVGENDIPQSRGLGPVEMAAGGPARRVAHTGAALFLRAKRQARAVELELAALGRTQIRLSASRLDGGLELGATVVDIEAGSGRRVAIELREAVDPGTAMRIDLAPLGEVLVRRARLLEPE